MKKTFKIIVTLLITVLALGCIYLILGNIFNQPEEEIDYITKEELFEYIETHDAGVTIEDFEGIDMEEFIKSGGGFRAGNEISPNYNFISAIEMYWYKKEIERIEPYLAYEIKMVDSTDEEFEEFKERFVKIIEESGRAIYPIERWSGNGFMIELKNNSYEIMIGQTKYFDLNRNSNDVNKIRVKKGNKNKQETAAIDFRSGLFVTSIMYQFYYSKSEKYFIFFLDRPGSLDDLNIIKAFYEAG